MHYANISGTWRAGSRGLKLVAACLMLLLGVRNTHAEPVSLRPDPKAPGFSAAVSGRAMHWSLQMRLGPDGRPLKPTGWSKQGEAHIVWQTDLSGEDLRLFVSVEAEKVGHWTVVQAFVRNDGSQRVLLEVAWRGTMAADAPHFWGGWRTPKTGARYTADRGGKCFPLAALYDDTSCLAIAYEPSQLLSYIRHDANLTHSPATLETATRLVIDPGQRQTLTLFVGAFETSWGYREPLHYYFEASSAWFWPQHDIDPRVNLNGGSYLVWRRYPDCDLARRMSVGWDWCYAPFRRTGDIYGRREFWDYKPARKPAKWRWQSWRDFHIWRKKRFAAGEKCDVVMAFYVPAQVWCEERLAREHYADAIIDDPKAKTYFNTPWVTGHDNELRVFPLNTTFGQQSRKDMEAVIHELGLHAFGFDTAGGGARYYGPAVDRCPGRAWDERGVFVEEAVAIAKLIDWVHEQHCDAGRVAVIINPGPYGSYMSTFRCDASMLESSPVSVANGLAQALRARLGHKTMVLWETFDYAQWLKPNLTREQYIDALRGVADWTVLKCLQVVAMPTPRIAMGMTPLVRWLPTIRDVVLAGWEPVPAAKRADGEWVSRAGRGLGCFLATGNATAHDKKIELVVDDAWIGHGRTLWASVGVNGPRLAIRHLYAKDGKTTITANVPSRQPLVLKAMGAFERLPDDLQAQVSLRGDCHAQTLTVNLNGQGPCTFILGHPAKWMNIRSVTFNNRSLPVARTANGRPVVEFELHGPAGLIVSYGSRVCRVSDRRLCTFPGIAGGKPNFVVVVPDEADKKVRRAAAWIAGYLRTYYKNAPDKPLNVANAEIVKASMRRPDTQAVVLTLGDTGSVGVPWEIRSPDEKTIEVVARTPADLFAGVRRLLAVWDEKYVWAGPLPGIDMFKRVGLASKQLPPR